jgi:uncharacterized protein (TIGR02271 family)
MASPTPRRGALPTEGAAITDRDGREALVTRLSADGVAVRFERATLVLPTDRLQQRGSRWATGLSFSDLASPSSPASSAERVVMREIDERLRAEKREVETGRVRLTKRVETREEAVSVPLLREEVEVERVSVGEYVDEAPPVRTEGDVTVIPVVEEVLVVEKRLLLREELRVTRRHTQSVDERTEVLRSETIDVERLPAQQERPPDSEPTSGPG